MNEDYSEDRLDFSGMSDDELFEIVNSRFGQYRQEMIDGAQDELRRRAERPMVEPEGRAPDAAPAEPVRQAAEGEAPPPAPLASVPGASVYSLGQITVATLLGSPVAGCLLLSQNSEALKVGSARRPLVIGIIATVVLVVLAFSLPENTPGSGFTIGACVGMYYYAKDSQGAAIESHLKAGGKRGSWPVVVLTAVVCAVVLLALLFVIVMTLDSLGVPVAGVNQPQTWRGSAS
ncbi:MAG TPA: hypothetical protein VGX48_18595 [Pyrinomonadaceae bacterium]|jgi:hypothetical protein|nr:hypothetical protein [Pyrinomonadaceae bacterium]